MKAGVVTVTTISGTSVVVDGTSAATLSADGKTLKIDTVSGTFKGQYVVKTNEETVKTTTGEFLPAYTSPVFTAEDTVSPTVSSVEKLNAVTVRVNFSEPLLSAGNWSFKFADGSTASVSPNTANLAKGYVDLTINSGIDAGKLINATILGATDFSSNLISPNPTTFSFSKGAVDGVKPAVQTVTSLGLNKFEVKFSELVQGFEATDLTVDGVARTSGNATITQDVTDKTKYTVTLTSDLTAGLHTLGLNVDAVSDMSGEMNAAFSKVVEFKADTTDPVVTKTEVKTESGAEYLYVNFSEAVDKGTVTGLTATEVKDFVTVNGTLDLSGLTVVAGTNEQQYKVALSAINFTPTSGGSAATIKTGASYSVALTGFDDKSGNDLASTTFSFTRAADTDLTKPTVVLADGDTGNNVADNGVKVVDNNTVRVTFSKALDGASATNKANYSINGLVIKSATLLPGNTVELKLEANTNNLDGLRNVSISGVKSSAGVSMDAFSTTEYFTENVKPTFTASATAANQITLTFSESVENVIEAAGFEEADFMVKVDGVSVTAFDPAVVVTEGGTDGEKSYTLTLSRSFTPAEYAKTITVTPTSDLDVVDTNDNALTFTSVTVTK